MEVYQLGNILPDGIRDLDFGTTIHHNSDTRAKGLTGEVSFACC